MSPMLHCPSRLTVSSCWQLTGAEHSAEGPVSCLLALQVQLSRPARNNGMKADVPSGSRKSYEVPSSPFLPFCRRGHGCALWVDRAIVDHADEFRWSGHHATERTLGAARMAEAAQTQPVVAGLFSLNRDKTETLHRLSYCFLWGFLSEAAETQAKC